MSEIFCQQCRKSKNADLFPATTTGNNSRRHCNACIEKAAKKTAFIKKKGLTEQNRVNSAKKQTPKAAAELEKFLKRTGNL